MSVDDVENLQSMGDIDPEVRPGLFQGDMALNNEVRGRALARCLRLPSGTLTRALSASVRVDRYTRKQCRFYGKPDYNENLFDF